ncbi:MAG: hypothetical protein K2W96_20605, partial [Gemmataceae bacterium]|nr:hypothetical protein [Gemmataceae bacterium]
MADHHSDIPGEEGSGHPSTMHPEAEGQGRARLPPVGAPLPFSERYQFVEVLGEGGLSVVSLAVDLVLERRVAIKELRPRYADHNELRLRFDREARTTASLELPGVPPVYDAGQHPDGRPWYSMRHIEGETLAQAAAHAGLPRLARAIAEACRTVEQAHRAG